MRIFGKLIRVGMAACRHIPSSPHLALALELSLFVEYRMS